MTAKEIAEKAKQEYRNFYKEVIVYEFTPKELKEFISQLCKEQRELCATTLKEHLYVYNFEEKSFMKREGDIDTIHAILSTEQPNIFEEKK